MKKQWGEIGKTSSVVVREEGGQNLQQQRRGGGEVFKLLDDLPKRRGGKPILTKVGFIRGELLKKGRRARGLYFKFFSRFKSMNNMF